VRGERAHTASAAELGRSVAAASSTVAASPFHGIVESVAARCPDRNIGAACGPLYWRARSARTRTRKRGSRNRGRPYILLDEARQAGTVAARTGQGASSRCRSTTARLLPSSTTWRISLAGTNQAWRPPRRPSASGARRDALVQDLLLSLISAPCLAGCRFCGLRADGLLVALVQLRTRAGSFGRPNKRGVLR